MINKLKSEWLMAVKFHVLMKYLMLFGGYRVTPFRTHSKSSLLAVMTKYWEWIGFLNIVLCMYIGLKGGCSSVWKERMSSLKEYYLQAVGDLLYL